MKRVNFDKETATQFNRVKIALAKLPFNKLDVYLRRKYDIPEEGFETLIALEKWRIDLENDIDKVQEYKKELIHTSQKIGLPQNHQTALEDYLTLNITSFSSEEVLIQSIYNRKTKEKELWLRILPTTRRDSILTNWHKVIDPLKNSIKEINKYNKQLFEIRSKNKELKLRIFRHTSQYQVIKNWNKIKVLQQKLPTYTKINREWGYFEELNLIYNETEKGKSYEEIANILNPERKEKEENNLQRYPLEQNEISKWKSVYKKKMKLNQT